MSIGSIRTASLSNSTQSSFINTKGLSNTDSKVNHLGRAIHENSNSEVSGKHLQSIKATPMKTDGFSLTAVINKIMSIFRGIFSFFSKTEGSQAKATGPTIDSFKIDPKELEKRKAMTSGEVLRDEVFLKTIINHPSSKFYRYNKENIDFISESSRFKNGSYEEKRQILQEWKNSFFDKESLSYLNVSDKLNRETLKIISDLENGENVASSVIDDLQLRYEHEVEKMLLDPSGDLCRKFIPDFKDGKLGI